MKREMQFVVLLMVGLASLEANAQFCPGAPGPPCKGACGCGPAGGGPDPAPGGGDPGPFDDPGPTPFGDPVHVAGNALNRYTDVELLGTFGFKFLRQYVNDTQFWRADLSLAGQTYNTFVPRPFGASQNQVDSLFWSHNLFTYVFDDFGAPRRWWLRNFDGNTYSFNPCADLSQPCWARPYDGSNDRMRLFWSGGASGYFVVYHSSGEKFVYDARWEPSAGTGVKHYFLRSVQSPQYSASGGPAATHLTLTYADPPGLTCHGRGPGSSLGTPYISSVTTADGTVASLYYKSVGSTPGIQGIGPECVLDKVTIQDNADGGQRTLVQYSYVLDGGQEWAGLLRSATQPEYTPPRVLNYEYLDGGSNAFIASQAGYVQTYQLIPTLGGNKVTVATGTTQDLRLGYQPSSGQITSCSQTGPSATTTVDAFARPGDGVPGSSLSSTRVIDGLEAAWAYSGARVWRITDNCDGGACNGMSQGTMQWEYNCDSVASYPSFSSLQAVKDKRDNWRFYGYQRPDAGIVAPADLAAGMYLMPEEQVEKLGTTDLNGSNPLQTKTFGYTYGSVGQTPRAYEQLRELTERDSVAAPSGTPNAKARTRNVYDPVTNRLKATINSGWTQRFDTTTQTWLTEQRFYGTFYFTTRVCTGESTPDPLGRTLEVHGPCWVTNESAADCPAGIAAPVTQYFFWLSTETSNRRNRLQKESRFPNNGGPANCSGFAHLDTMYNQYDVRGNPTEVIDANGVSTIYTYEGESLRSTTTSGLTTNFTYDNGELTAIQYPQGNYEVFCYRTGTAGPACSGGSWTPLLQWKAKADSADGSNYSEKVVYAYWPNGTIQSETYITSSGEVRRVRKYAVDAHRRPTFEQWGDGSGAFSATRGFDGSDNLSRIGLPANVAPSWCIDPGNGQPSTKCSQMTYDRANRLAIVDEYPTSSSNPGIRTCIDHDAHGNVAKVSPGCQTAQPCAGLDGGVSSCTTAASGYKYDDFGNLIQATLPWLDDGTGAVGTINYEYDARGNLLTKQTPAMGPNREWLAYTYDMLARNLSATHYWALPVPGSENLYQLAHDSSQNINNSCVDPNVPANTQGRLLLRTDSFGQTWYRYDALGRVTREIRLRTGACDGTITNNPHTVYTYTDNGHLASITHPHGRVVTYVYGAGANSDRVQEVDIAIANGGSSWTTVPAITAVVWEPYEGLRGYQINSSGNTGAVEYFLGDNAASPGCPAAPPASNDHTGRLRAVRVSTGPFIPGVSSGDIYKRTYTWQADQVAQIDTCLLASATPLTETYSYDQLARLLTAAGTLGSSFASRTYSYDARSNRSGQMVEGCPWTLTYGTTTHPDQLTTSSSGCPGAILKHDYTFDSDGRVAVKNWPLDSSGSPAYTLAFQSGPSDSGATDSVFKSVLVNGAAYNYFYDAFGRRRFKSYPPDGANDEYFHGMRSELISDRGVDSLATAVAGYPEDDYVWLDGRPVAILRGKLDATWARLPDSTTDCMRNDEPAVCGLYFIISDHLSKPTLLLDSSQKIAGVLDYEPFGYANRVALDRETPHPYPNNDSRNIADFTQPVGGPLLSLKMRVLLHMVDVEDGPGDYAMLKDGDPPQSALTPPIGGYHRGQMWTPWVQPQAGHIIVPFISDGQNCCPDGMGGLICVPNLCPSYPNYPYQGIVMEGYEYQRYQTGAAIFGIPLRFPGQYFDAETDLFENWNRYYDASIGRYLQTEPVLQDPRFVTDQARQGRSTLSYAYALNNPLLFGDSTGLAPNDKWSCERLKKYIDDLTKEINKRWEELKENRLKLPICKPGAPLREDQLGHLAIILKLHFQRNAAMILYDAKGCGGPPGSPRVFPFRVPGEGPVIFGFGIPAGFVPVPVP